MLLYLVSILGDLLDDLVVVGGLVPSLLVTTPAVGEEPHVGTADLDLGLEIALLDSQRYHTLAERLRGHGFLPDRNEQGQVTRQRWRHPETTATVDFLMPPVTEGQRGGSLQDLEADLAAVVMPGLGLAFRDRELVSVTGRTLLGENLTREVPVCGPGAFVVLKARALRQRGENKDAYDIYYLVRHYGENVEVIAQRLRPLLDDGAAREAVSFLEGDFSTVDSIGPSRAAAFLSRLDDQGFRADVAGLVQRLIRGLAG
jgi:hypothetical protein